VNSAPEQVAGEARRGGILAWLQRSPYWRDVAWLASGTAAAQVINLAAMPVFSRLFSPADFAVQNLFVQLTLFLGVLITFRYEYLVKIPARDVDAWQLMSLVVVLGGGATVLLTPIAWVFRTTFARWAGDAQLAPWMALLPVTAAATSLSVALQHYTQRKQQYGRSATGEIVGRVALAGTTLVGYFTLPGAGGLVLSGLGGPVAKIGWLLRVCDRRFQEQPATHQSLAATHGRMGGSLVLSHFLLALSGIIPLTYVAHAYGPTTLGQFAMANGVVALPSSLVGNAIGDVFYQRAAQRWAEGKGFADIWRTTAAKLLIIGLPMYTIAGVAMPWAFPFVFGRQWVEAGEFGSLLCIVGFLSFASSPMGWANVVVDVDWYGPVWMVTRTVTAGVTVVLAMAWHLGARAFVIATVVQTGAMYLLDYWAKWRFSNRVPIAMEKPREGAT